MPRLLIACLMYLCVAICGPSAHANAPLTTTSIFSGIDKLQDGRFTKSGVLPNGHIRAWGGADLFDISPSGQVTARRRISIVDSVIDGSDQYVLQSLTGRCRVRKLDAMLRDVARIDVLPNNPSSRCSNLAVLNSEIFLFTGEDAELTRISADFSTATKLSTTPNWSRLLRTKVFASAGKLYFYAAESGGLNVVAVNREGQTQFSTLITSSPGPGYGLRLTRDSNRIALAWHTNSEANFAAVDANSGALILPQQIASGLPVASVDMAFIARNGVMVATYDEAAIAIYDPTAGARVVRVGLPPLRSGVFDTDGNIWLKAFFSDMRDVFVKLDAQGQVLQRFRPAADINPLDVLVIGQRVILSGSQRLNQFNDSPWIGEFNASALTPNWQIRPTTRHSLNYVEITHNAAFSSQRYALHRGVDGVDASQLWAIAPDQKVLWRADVASPWNVIGVTQSGVFVRNALGFVLYSHSGQLAFEKQDLNVRQIATAANGDVLVLSQMSNEPLRLLRYSANGTELTNVSLSGFYALNRSADALFGLGANGLSKLNFTGQPIWTVDCASGPLIEDAQGNFICTTSAGSRKSFDVNGNLRWTSTGGAAGERSALIGNSFIDISSATNNMLLIKRQSMQDGSLQNQTFAIPSGFDSPVLASKINPDGSVLVSLRGTQQHCIVHLLTNNVEAGRFCEKAPETYFDPIGFDAWLNNKGGVNALVYGIYSDLRELQFKQATDLFQSGFELPMEL